MDILKKHENHTRLRWSMVILCFFFAKKGLHYSDVLKVPPLEIGGGFHEI